MPAAQLSCSCCSARFLSRRAGSIMSCSAAAMCAWQQPGAWNRGLRDMRRRRTCRKARTSRGCGRMPPRAPRSRHSSIMRRIPRGREPCSFCLTTSGKSCSEHGNTCLRRLARHPRTWACSRACSSQTERPSPSGSKASAHRSSISLLAGACQAAWSSSCCRENSSCRNSFRRTSTSS